MAKIICFEGSDGLGKTTQANILKDILMNKDYRVKYYKLPSHGFFGKIIQDMLKNGSAKKNPNIFQVINFFDKLFFQMSNLLITNYDYIILDRWKMSSLTYGVADGANKKFLEILNHYLKEPNVTFVFTGDNFLDGKAEKDCFELDRNLQKKVEHFYLMYGFLNQSHFISANQTIEEVSSNINQIIEKKFRGKNG